MRVLLTGGYGYIGSEVARQLRKRGEDVTIADPTAIYMDADGFDDVLHLGAMCDVGESAKIPSQYYVRNVAETAILANALPARTRIVFTSSCAAMGTPVSVYGRTKAMCEDIMVDCRQNWAILRLFNVAGASPLHDTAPQTNRIIPAICKHARTGTPLIVTGDGSIVRDYVHVIDAAAAVIAAMDYLRAGNPPLLCEIGSGIGISINDLIRIARDTLDDPLNVEYAPARKGDQQSAVSQPTVARKVLRWFRKHPSIEGMLKSADAHARRYEAQK